jgi:hypothetical protein
MHGLLTLVRPLRTWSASLNMQRRIRGTASCSRMRVPLPNATPDCSKKRISLLTITKSFIVRGCREDLATCNEPKPVFGRPPLFIDFV